MNRYLCDWDQGFADVWDDQGHTTKDTGEMACVCGVVEHMMPYVHQGAALASTIDVDDPRDYTDVFTDLVVKGMTEWAVANGVDADSIFSSHIERCQFGESYQDLCVSCIGLDVYKRLDLMYDMMVSYFD